MGKMILVFLVLFVIISGGIKAWLTFSVKEKWETVKILGFSAFVSFIVVVILTGIVILF